MEIVNGNLFNTSAYFIAHQVNAMGVMGSGVAKQVRNRYPNVYNAYVDFIKENKDILPGKEILGHSFICGTPENHAIINVFGQYKYGYDGGVYTDYSAFRRGFIDAIEQIRENWDITYNPQIPIAIPYKIGSDRGGADWEEICKILKQIEKEKNVVFIAYKL